MLSKSTAHPVKSILTNQETHLDSPKTSQPSEGPLEQTPFPVDEKSFLVEQTSFPVLEK
jgi:hypothetical protein